ncbi:MAG: GreA/GreB family elongation factor [Deltaproteobacteria bacterium]|nr:GreA/GreB family elongation factor [Deltaproteobacteria bacterium]
MRLRGLPVPTPNLVTSAGLAAAQAEHARLTQAGGDADRVRELAAHLATAQVADPPADPREVAFGARVTIEDDAGERHVYAIVGAIEADPKRGALSWRSPLAQALWGLRVGDGVALPRGDGAIVAIDYP